MTALNSEGLEKARAAIMGNPFNDEQLGRIISAYLSALPPVDGLEVVAWDVAPKGLPAEPTKSHSFVAEIERQGGSITPLVTLSQASSVIAGLRSERITAERDALEAYRKLQAAETRIASLEQANEALMRERTNLIETKREQVGRLAKERDETQTNVACLTKQPKMFFAKLPTGVCDQPERISSLEEENKRMREANEALMRDRTSMIATHRESINRLTLKIGALEAKAEHAARQALEDHNG